MLSYEGMIFNYIKI